MAQTRKGLGNYLLNLTNLQFHTSGFYGDIISLSSLTNLEKRLELWSNPEIYGDISALANMPNLKVLAINFTQVYGDISVFANLTKLVYIE